MSPFLFDQDHSEVLLKETLGNTQLERRPLFLDRGELMVLLPTAIGAAVRRFVVEAATHDGALASLQNAINWIQQHEVFELGCSSWDLDIDKDLQPRLYGRVTEAIARFDEGAYAQVLFVADDLATSIGEGLRGIDDLSNVIDQRIEDTPPELAAKHDYRRGLTILVHGGVGRGFSVGFHEAPNNWQFLGLSLPEFLRLGWDSQIDAMRAWKLLWQEDALIARGTPISNLNGFPNLYAYALSQSFHIVPDEMTFGMIGLAPNFLTSLRHRLRSTLDKHLVVGPDSARWIEVQRETTEVFFAEAKNTPLFISPGYVLSGVLLACIETSARPWWIECRDKPEPARHRSIIYQVWNMAANWLVSLSSILEDEVSGIPQQPIHVHLRFDDLSAYDEDPVAQNDVLRGPEVVVEHNSIKIGINSDYIRTFAHPRNVGDSLMVRAIGEGVCLLAGLTRDEGLLTRIVHRTLKSDEARFFHTVPARNVKDMIYAAVTLPKPRLQSLEDSAWSRLGLAQVAGWEGGSGSIPRLQAGKLMHQAVDAIWKGIRDSLLKINRASIVERCMINHDAIGRDRETWRMTASALLALYTDIDNVLQTANEREGQRGLAGLASRVIAEMALCTSPSEGGFTCATADIDELIAMVGTLLDCAAQSDALRYGLTSELPVVNGNGSFRFDRSFTQTLHQPYMAAHGERVFRAAAADYGAPFQDMNMSPLKLDARFEAAFKAEFAIELENYYSFASRIGLEAIEQGKSQFYLNRGRVIQRLSAAKSDNPEHTYEALCLKPRDRWDEARPDNARARDWYPWMFNRRLSLLRRPLIQITDSPDPDVLLVPALIDSNVRYLCEAVEGRIPIEVFDSSSMRSWIGAAVDERGHEFNRLVSNRLIELGWHTIPEVKISSLGGPARLGDIDVLAWDSKKPIVYVIECKRLLFARTIGEIGERLIDYTSVRDDGDRTSIQKHHDRMNYLRKNMRTIASYIGRTNANLDLQSMLVTDYIVPMQFQKSSGFVNHVVDFESLEELFSLLP